MSFLPLIMIFFMIAALGVVVIGVIAMAVNGKLNKKHGNKLMRLRVLFQAIAIVIFVIVIWLARN
tara:strand:- start:177 stop:371 length:195 start_codon:yes stop_codon:yes gene_type:complete